MNESVRARVRALSAVPCLLTFLAATNSAIADFVGFSIDNQRAFFTVGFSGPINHVPPPDPIGFGLPGGLANWMFVPPPQGVPGVQEWQNFDGAGTDAIEFNPIVKHNIAPHGELPNPNVLRLSTGHVHNPTILGFRFSGRFDIENHPALGHSDVGASVAGSVALPQGREIQGWFGVAGGFHTGPIQFGLATLEGFRALSPFGGAVWNLDPATGEFDLGLALSGILGSDLMSASIRLGTPRDPGIPIFDLQPALFSDVTRLGTARVFFGEQFPLDHVSSLITGDTFLEIVTPDGIINGQLVKIPEPAALSLLALGGLLIRRRRHR